MFRWGASGDVAHNPLDECRGAGFLPPPAGGAVIEVFGVHPFGDSILWLGVKISAVLFMFLWVRATFPRYRYDQIMRLGWKVFIPVTLVWIVFLAVMMQTPWAYLFH